MLRLILILLFLLSLSGLQADVLDDLRYDAGKEQTRTTPSKGAPIPDFSVAQAPPKNESGLWEYRIGPMDVIEVEVFQSVELGRVARVNTEGYISLPLIGGVKVAGMTTQEAERHIERLLAKDYMQDPHVTVFVKEYESQKITVEGWVKNPGVFPMTGRMTFLQAIAKARGLERVADFDEVAVFRTENGKTTGYILSYNKIRAGEQVDPVLKAGDIIIVNRSGSKNAWRVFVETMNSFIGWQVLF